MLKSKPVKRTTFGLDAKAASELKPIGKRLGNLTLGATIRFALADFIKRQKRAAKVT